MCLLNKPDLFTGPHLDSYYSEWEAATCQPISAAGAAIPRDVIFFRFCALPCLPVHPGRDEMLLAPRTL